MQGGVKCEECLRHDRTLLLQFLRAKAYDQAKVLGSRWLTSSADADGGARDG